MCGEGGGSGRGIDGVLGLCRSALVTKGCVGGAERLGAGQRRFQGGPFWRGGQ